MRALGILVTAPIPGRVKPHLAADIGPSGAADVCWRLGRQVVAATVGAGQRTTVWFSPAREGPFVREWLDGLGQMIFRPQVGVSLADRLAHASAREFAEGARRVVLIGSDCPGVSRRLAAAAFAALAECDVVLGPVLSGGWYLVGLSRPQPALFRGISWSTPAVAIRTVARARALGLRCRTLPPLRDVQTALDARVHGLLRPKQG